MPTVTRRDFLATGLACGLGLASSTTGAVHGRTKQRPNILFIFTDDHAQQAIGAYGSRINRTPNIDRIALEGALFRNNTCCNSICAPSRAAVLTGKHSHANGQRTNADTFDASQPTFPRQLQAAGYHTALIGKWHLRSDPTGFDHWEIFPGQGSYYNPDMYTQSATKQYEGYATDIVTDLSLKWLESRPGPGKPFLLMCQHKAPHRTWAPGPDHLTLYNDATIPEPETLFDNYEGRASGLKNNEMTIARHMMLDYDLKVPDMGIPDALGRDMKNNETERMTVDQKSRWDAAYAPENEAFRNAKIDGEALTRWKYQRYIKDYLRCVASVDDNIGRMLDFLDETGLAENTIVVYSSDQGFFLGEHGLYDKRWMYRESFAMPLIMRWPRVIKPGTQVEQLTQNIDFAPTFLDAAGLSVPRDMHGESLLPLMQGRHPRGWRKSLYYHYYETGEHHVPRHEGVQDSRYKLIHYYDLSEWELFDLERDPNELKSVYGEKRYARVQKRLSGELTRLQRHYNVPAKSNM